jgi:hypothetical protein
MSVKWVTTVPAGIFFFLFLFLKQKSSEAPCIKGSKNTHQAQAAEQGPTKSSLVEKTNYTVAKLWRIMHLLGRLWRQSTRSPSLLSNTFLAIQDLSKPMSSFLL